MKAQKTSDDAITLSGNSTPNWIPDLSPQEYYYKELRNVLDKIKTSLTHLQKEPRNLIYLQQIKDSAEAASDLAMIHGYEGVENIAKTIRSSSDHILGQNQEIGESFISKVDLAVKAIRQVMDLEENIFNRSSQDKFDKRLRQKQEKVESHAKKISNYFDRLFSNQLELPFDNEDFLKSELKKMDETTSNQDDEALFDICEIDSVMTLADDSPSTNSTNVPTAVNDADVSLKFGEETKGSNVDFPRFLSSDDMSFNELTIDAKEQLSEFEQAINELQVVPYAGNAIQNLYKACDALQKTARKLNDKNLSIVLDPLQKSVHQKLRKPGPASDTILDLLNQTTDLIYSHLEYNRDDEKELKKLGHKIERLLNVKSVGLPRKEMKSKHLGPEIKESVEKQHLPKNKAGHLLKRLSKKK